MARTWRCDARGAGAPPLPVPPLAGILRGPGDGVREWQEEQQNDAQGLGLNQGARARAAGPRSLLAAPAFAVPPTLFARRACAPQVTPQANGSLQIDFTPAK